jgi:hypothetical protein
MKGNAAELAIAAEAARLGLTVLMPITEHERYDLVLGISGRLFRVQCKWASRRGEVIQVRLRSSYHSPTRGYVVRTYAADEVDLVAVHCGDLGRSYLLPVDVFAGKGAVYLRLGPARNNQRASVHFAARYEFPGAVAQLAERLAGSEEARGSNPLSSIVEDPPRRPRPSARTSFAIASAFILSALLPVPKFRSVGTAVRTHDLSRPLPRSVHLPVSRSPLRPHKIACS